MKENLKPCAYKLWKHYVVALSQSEGLTADSACRKEADSTEDELRISDSAQHETDRTQRGL